MFAPGVVTFEKTSHLEAMLKRFFHDSPTVVRPCRLARQVLTVLHVMGGSVVVIDLTSGAESALRLIAQIHFKYPDSPIIVITTDSLLDLEWPAREFGTWVLLPNSITESVLGRTCQRLLETMNSQ